MFTEVYTSLNRNSLLNCNLNDLWFCSQSDKLSGFLKTRMTMTIVRSRNLMISLYLIQFIFSIIRLILISFQKNAINIIFNVVTIIIDLLGFFGGTRFNVFLMSIHFFSNIILIILFLTFLLLSAFSGNNSVRDQAFMIYIPLLTDTIFVLIHGVCFCRCITWHIKCEDDEQKHPYRQRQQAVPSQDLLIQEQLIQTRLQLPQPVLQNPPSIQLSAIQQQIGQIERNPPPLRNIQKNIKILPQIKKQKINETGNQNQNQKGLCPICFSNVINTVILNCKHSACYTCIEKCRSENNKCPICRQEITDTLKFFTS